MISKRKLEKILRNRHDIAVKIAVSDENYDQLYMGRAEAYQEVISMLQDGKLLNELYKEAKQ